MNRLIERGVGGLVTNAPEEAIRIRRDARSLDDTQRRLIAARYLLGLDPEPRDRDRLEDRYQPLSRPISRRAVSAGRFFPRT